MVYSDLFCRLTQQILLLKKLIASTAAMENPLQFSLAFVLQAFVFPDATPLLEPGNHSDSQPRPQQLPCCKMTAYTPAADSYFWEHFWA